MLMDIPEPQRAEFLVRVTRGSEPRYGRRLEGDPVKQAQWKARLPIVYTQIKILELKGT